MSDESQDLKPTAGIYACQTPDREESSLEREKAEINNALLKGLVERNEQRKKHRGCLFGFGIAACAVFYFLFIVTVCYLYFCHLYALERLPAAWALPLLGLLAVPTIFLIIMALSLYRERPEITPATLITALQKLLANIGS